MGLSTHAVGFKPADEKWRKMKAIFDNCVELGLPVPKEVMVSEKVLTSLGAVKLWGDGGGCEGFEIVVSKIPSDVTIIRIYNNW